MISYNFYNPTKLVFGENTIEKIGELLSNVGSKKVLMIAGSGSIKKNNVYDITINSLRKNGIEWRECWGVRANPSLAKVREAIAIAKKEKVDAVLAVGGGSVIDTTKIVAAGVYADDIWQVFERKEKIKKALPIFTILTLSATASEMNCSAVISNDEENKKWGTGSPLLYPVASIIQPDVQNTLPWNQTVNGALDAMAHIMEYYFIGTNEETSIAVNEALLKTIIKSVEGLKVDAKDTISRANLAWAITLGLNGISGAGLKGGDWACHDMSHSISCMYPQIAHGGALGVIFPAWMKYVCDSNPQQFKRFAKNVLLTDDIESGIYELKQLLKSWNAATSLRELGVKEEDLRKLAEMTVSRGNIGKLSVLRLADVEKILEFAF
ncbi:iron-containing alcohol dehydrogenase [Anaerosinus gibii]|uniref:Iron-containing alcohol dehydrogenase n=1 Tax=Selenobaculum gibii TaxID=3054208 RepID=A0A9Y2ERE0_9FIRM|nr:iron-containing alcohol dehydrogenase [Selenobaculum gbiensis]WIW69723.1 iron-containing alcohol dehydrogenase [Selenobaculum gbiensis]